MNELALFAGAGGGILGGKLLGWNTVCAVEIEAYCASILAARQNDGILPPFPIWNDIRTFDGKRWRGFVDVVSGGFPCQDISPAKTNTGSSGRGLDGTKSGLWFEMLRVVYEVRPQWVLVENSAHLRTKGLGIILKGLAEAGYDAQWGVLGASDLGANHQRKRMWILAHSNNYGKSTRPVYDEAQGVSGIERVPTKSSDAYGSQCERDRSAFGGKEEQSHPRVGSWWKDISHLDGMDDWVAYRLDRLKAIGNGQVPVVAATAFKLLQGR